MAVRAGYFQGGLTEAGRPMHAEHDGDLPMAWGPDLNRKGGQEEAH